MRSLWSCGTRYWKLSRLTPSGASVSETFSTTAGDKYDAFQPKSSQMLPPGTFANRTAFITGSGTGLGKSIAHSLARLGSNVFLVGREEGLKLTSDELADNTKSTAIAYANADIRDAKTIRDALNACRVRFGLPDLIVNNVADNFLCPSERLSTNAFSSVIDFVLKGTGLVTLEVAKALITARRTPDIGYSFSHFDEKTPPPRECSA
ncbi:unnamed protein product [Echinostoma caproni]|uniref:NAD(P)-binding protein n=1 Tax=Echinostoma caproni TaxID=27848 RepID=A0A183B7I2_9TREM|nr:unnamed protein product [Echinostoma caproni]